MMCTHCRKDLSCVVPVLVLMCVLFQSGLLVNKLFGQGYMWVRPAGGVGEDVGQSIAVDNLTNIYTAGYFQLTLDFGVTNFTSQGPYDIFLTRHDPSGALLWAKQAGGPGNDFGNGVAVDDQGNLYVTGSFEGTASFGTTNVT